jgi:CheY-like chemotaxis protein
MELILIAATLLGGIVAFATLVAYVKRSLASPPLQTPSASQLRARLKMLVVDDKRFTYFEDFDRDGYQITHWFQVDSLGALEGYEFDVVVLDIRGIAKHLNEDDGLGIARHLRDQQPSLPIVLYSSDSYSIAVDRTSADEIFDVVGGDYPRFRGLIDSMYARLCDPSFYLRNFGEADTAVSDKDRKALSVAVQETLADPRKANQPMRLSSHAATNRGAEILRHARRVSARLHEEK